MDASNEYAVVGAGPVGTLVAAALAENAIPFIWIVRSPERRTQLAELSVQFPEGSRSFGLEQAEIRPGADGLRRASRVFLAVKAQNVREVLDALPGHPPASVVCIGNGLQRGPQGVGLLYGGGFLNSGVLVTNHDNRLVVGGLDSSPQDWTWVAQVLNCSFLATTASARIQELMWHKLAINCVVNPLTAMLDCDNGDLLGRLHGPLVQAILNETHAVMTYVLEPMVSVPTTAELLLAIKDVLRATRYNSSSMREDLRRGRETEIHQINGAVIDEGARLGLFCPVNAQVVDMISLLSRAG